MSIISNWGYNRRATHFLCAKSSLMKNHLKLSLFETDWNVFLFFPKCLFNFLTWIQSFLLDYNLSPPMNITPLMDQNQTFCHLTPPDQSLGSLHLSWPIPWLCLLLLLSVRPPPPFISSWYVESKWRIMGGRQFLCACKKEQSVPEKSAAATVLQNMLAKRVMGGPAGSRGGAPLYPSPLTQSHNL